MDPRFLRDEAARFRVMAEDTEREASKLRLLAMAADYEARAIAADRLVKPAAHDTSSEPSEQNPDEDAMEPAESPLEAAPRTRTGKLTLSGPKDTEVVKRRPLVRRKPA